MIALGMFSSQWRCHFGKPTWVLDPNDSDYDGEYPVRSSTLYVFTWEALEISVYTIYTIAECFEWAFWMLLDYTSLIRHYEDLKCGDL